MSGKYESIKIERRVPIPKIATEAHNAVYPWRQMRIGDSFFTRNTTTNMHTAARWAGISIKVRSEGNGRRIWRVG